MKGLTGLSDIGIGTGEGRKKSQRNHPTGNLAFGYIEGIYTSRGFYAEVPSYPKTKSQVDESQQQGYPVLDKIVGLLIILIVINMDIHA